MSESKFDNVVGDGSLSIAAGSYKAPVVKRDKEGQEYTDEETRYKFQIRFDMPKFTQEQIDALVPEAVHRKVSVKAAGLFNEKTEYGSVEVAREFADALANGDSFFEYFMTKKERMKGERVSGITPLIQASRDCLELGLMQKRGLNAQAISPADLKSIRAEVRQHQKDNTPQWVWALAKGEKELANRMKKAGDMPD